MATSSQLYPKELESTERLRDGTLVSLRPIGPDDEPLLHDLAAHMTPEDRRLRFFAPMHDIPHTLAVRLTHLDYDREMALAAMHEGTVLGIARYAATDPERASAEYAIAVRSDWKGRGLGYLLMQRLIDVAQLRGIGELTGIVLRENKPMLLMSREFGFTPASDPADASVVRVTKPLR